MTLLYGDMVSNGVGTTDSYARPKEVQYMISPSAGTIVSRLLTLLASQTGAVWTNVTCAPLIGCIRMYGPVALAKRIKLKQPWTRSLP